MRKKIPTPVEKKEPLKELVLKIDADKARLSNILQLKKIFSECAGSSPVTLGFISKGKTIGNIMIDARRGVHIGEMLDKNLKKIDNIMDIAVVSK